MKPFTRPLYTLLPIALMSLVIYSSAGLAAAATKPAKTVSDRSLGVKLTLPAGWLRLGPPKEPQHVIILATRRSGRAPSYNLRLQIESWGVTKDKNATAAVNAGLQRLLTEFKHPPSVSLSPAQYGGSPGILVRGLPASPHAAADIILAHAGAVYLIIVPGTFLARDQQRALSSLRFITRHGAFPPAR